MINTLLGTPLGLIIYFAYQLTGSYGVAILIFSIIIKIIIYPITLLSHKNAIKFLQLQPALGVLKKRYAGEKEKLNEEQYQLFKEKGYNVFLGILPLMIQLILIMGMLQVMYRPLQHMIRLEQPVIDVLVDEYRLHSAPDPRSAMDQLHVLQAAQDPRFAELFVRAMLAEDVLVDGVVMPSGNEIVTVMTDIDMTFFGIDLGATPSLRTPSILWVIPALAGTLALIFCLVQNKISPGALTQSPRANLGMTIFTVSLSLYFAFVMPAGVGLYWALGNFFGMVVTIILNITHGSRKLAGDALDYMEANRLTPTEVKQEKQLKKKLTARSKTDAARFARAEKELVFYALSGGQYKFYQNTIEYLLEHSNLKIHYLTNDPDDGVFQMSHERFMPYFATQGRTITLLLKLKADMFVTTVPDLQIYHMKRSVVKEEIEYVHVVHGLSSTHMAAREKAYDYFDTIFCVGPHQVNEIKARVNLAGLKPKKLVASGYGLYDQLVDAYQENADVVNEQPHILIAPSWQSDNILESCIDELLVPLFGNGFKIILRPHIQFVNMFPRRMKELAITYQKQVESGELVLDLDFSNNKYIFTSDVLITDWSGIAYEFSYCSLKPSVFINTPMKVLNPNYESYDVEVLDITLRDKVGVSVEMDQLETVGAVVSQLLNEKETYQHKIEEVIENYLYHPHRSGEASAKYIMNQLEKK
ncbi:MAG: membrane protein insertase YidC [Turicibacter sp.]|nr:membrane protein insertase YidC [Turicibacter sp.]